MLSLLCCLHKKGSRDVIMECFQRSTETAADKKATPKPITRSPHQQNSNGSSTSEGSQRKESPTDQGGFEWRPPSRSKQRATKQTILALQHGNASKDLQKVTDKGVAAEAVKEVHEHFNQDVKIALKDKTDLLDNKTSEDSDQKSQPQPSSSSSATVSWSNVAQSPFPEARPVKERIRQLTPVKSEAVNHNPAFKTTPQSVAEVGERHCSSCGAKEKFWGNESQIAAAMRHRARHRYRQYKLVWRSPRRRCGSRRVQRARAEESDIEKEGGCVIL
ncbi:UNVERIFIED_CONTAM: hypothetical protein FKN15_040976 [Acipenser sinensis]